MKTASLPPLRVDPELREAAEAVLEEGESLSKFIEQSIRINIDRRRAQQAFVERGFAVRDRARTRDDYVSAETVLKELDGMLAAARTRAGKTRK